MEKQLFRLEKHNFLNLLGFLRIGNRELITISWITEWTGSPLFGFDVNFGYDVPIHFGMNIGNFTFHIQLFGIQYFPNEIASNY